MGSNAVEATIKLEKHNNGVDGLSFRGGYHELTAGGLSFTAGKKYKSDYESMFLNAHHVPYPDPRTRNGDPEDASIWHWQSRGYNFNDVEGGI